MGVAHDGINSVNTQAAALCPTKSTRCLLLEALPHGAFILKALAGFGEGRVDPSRFICRISVLHHHSLQVPGRLSR